MGELRKTFGFQSKHETDNNQKTTKMSVIVELHYVNLLLHNHYNCCKIVAIIKISLHWDLG